MKTIYLLSIASSLLFASCSKDHKEGQASDRADQSTSVSADSSQNKNNNPEGQPTYDGSASSKEATEHNSSSTETKKHTVDHATREFNGRSKYDSTVMNSGVAGEQGAGAGVGNGGSINAADKNKKVK